MQGNTLFRFILYACPRIALLVAAITAPFVCIVAAFSWVMVDPDSRRDVMGWSVAILLFLSFVSGLIIHMWTNFQENEEVD